MLKEPESLPNQLNAPAPACDFAIPASGFTPPSLPKMILL